MNVSRTLSAVAEPRSDLSAATSRSTTWRTAAAVLDDNWSHDHTVPSRRLYPHQWSWDAGFVAIGLAHHNPDRAWRDLHSLFEAQWPDGRVPHIVFDPRVAEGDYFPGPAFWDVPAFPDRRPRGSTALVQPPVHAIAALAVYRRATGQGAGAAAGTQLRWLYPHLVAQQAYLSGARDAGGTGLVSIVHPWESGLDNSPAWDAALARVPAERNLLAGHKRRDIQVAAAAHRPTDTDYARYIGLVASYRDRDYDDSTLVGRHPFVVECPAFNALYGAAEVALADIAEAVGADPAPHRERAARITRDLVEHLHDPRTGAFHARDVLTGRLSPARCVAGLVPLILPDLPADLVAGIVTEATSERFGLPVPSYDRTAADFDPQRYWRGPIWVNINWLLRAGLLTHGYDSHAESLRTSLLDLVRRGGLFEYFHPVTGQGLGASAFSWTAALTLDLLAAGSQVRAPCLAA